MPNGFHNAALVGNSEEAEAKQLQDIEVDGQEEREEIYRQLEDWEVSSALTPGNHKVEAGQEGIKGVKAEENKQTLKAASTEEASARIELMKDITEEKSQKRQSQEPNEEVPNMNNKRGEIPEGQPQQVTPTLKQSKWVRRRTPTRKPGQRKWRRQVQEEERCNLLRAKRQTSQKRTRGMLKQEYESPIP